MAKLIESNAEGTVRTYNDDRGYGFILTFDVPDEIADSTDVFFHISDIPTNIVKEGWRFRFNLMETEDGYRARNIRLISKGRSRKGGQSRKRKENKDKPMPDDEVGDPYIAEMSKRKKQDEETDEEDDSPFNDPVKGSKNDLLK